MDKAYGFHSFDNKNKKGDLIESILGAVAFDSGWNMDILCSVLKHIVKYKDIDVDYVGRLEKICRKKHIAEPVYRFSQIESMYECCVSVPDADGVFMCKAETMQAEQNESVFRAWYLWTECETYFYAVLPQKEHP